MVEWRVVSMDQRGHGFSDHSSDYSRAAFVGDITALLDHLGACEPALLIGNSLGGINAFFFAALVVEESPPEQHEPMTFMLDWRGVYPTSEALEQKIGARLDAGIRSRRSGRDEERSERRLLERADDVDLPGVGRSGNEQQSSRRQGARVHGRSKAKHREGLAQGANQFRFG